MSVRVGCLDWREQHLSALRWEHVVEVAGELRVAVAEHNAQPPSSLRRG